jgi:hypothetical protein
MDTRVANTIGYEHVQRRNAQRKGGPEELKTFVVERRTTG